MTAAGPEDAAAVPREANPRGTARVPGRRSTFRPASPEAAEGFVDAIAAAVSGRFPDAPLVRVVERTANGQKMSEGFLVRRDGDHVQVVSQGEHWLVPEGASVRDFVTGERIGAPPVVIPERLRDHLIDFFRESLGWSWPEDDTPSPHRIPSAQEALEDLVDDLGPLIADERKRAALEALDGAIGLQVVYLDQDEQEFTAIEVNDLAEYRQRWADR